jgi:hypothetical protein
VNESYLPFSPGSLRVYFLPVKKSVDETRVVR